MSASALAAAVARPEIATPQFEATGSSRLELVGVRKQWGRNRAPVLRDCNLSLPAGAVVAVVGRNGAGKTTLLRIAGGLIAADAGSAALDGLDPFKDRRRYQERLGYVSAGQGGLYPRLRVAQMLDYWSRLALIPRADRKDAIAAVVDRVGLGDLLGSRLDRISSGQRQRVRLALGFMHSPALVLLDEPHSSLDADGYASLAMLVEERIASGATVVCCAPSVEELRITPDLAFVVEGGEVLPA
jgi:ABC-2 type transport system ATP-binding protein